jgi:hypothetical protein
MPERTRPRGYVEVRDYICCKHRNRTRPNGDVIVGQVESVRTNGKVLIKNLISGGISIKKMATLMRKNVRITKKQTDRILATHRTQGWNAAKEEAVLVYEEIKRAEGRPVPPPTSAAAPTESRSKADAFISEFRAFSQDTQAYVSRALWGEVLAVFGVD